MTRIEKILQSAQEYTSSGDYSPSLKDCFIAGVKWADENPKEGLVNIDKVCQWLENECDIKEYLSGIFSGSCSIDFDFEKLSNNLRKAMEE